jgi:chromate transporter
MEKGGHGLSVEGQNPSESEPRRAKTYLAELFLSFLRLGISAFGGPAMVAYIGDLSVKRKKWIGQETFKTGVALCQIIPGATAMQVAAYVGLQARGVLGALSAFIGFGLPAFVLMVILSYLYVAAGNLIWIRALFSGLQVVVVALVANATYTFAKQTVKGYADILIAVASASLFWFGVSPFYVILGAALAGLLFKKQDKYPAVGDKEYPAVPLFHISALIIVVLGGIVCLYFLHRDLFRLVLLMMKIDLFAFGGGFASVPLMLQEIVNVRGWMDSKVFMDGIALGQITPGPIVITATFVGYLLYGISGAITATIAIFTPSFLLVVAGAQFFNRLNRSAFFRKAVKGIFSSFVGLLLYVTIKFGITVPWDVARGFIVCAALAALLRKIDILFIVLAAALLGVILFR